jgi:hypothetical protein
MSCCDNNYGWGGGCGCGTVQYAPPACNPNFPTACTPLGQANIVRVVGEDSNSCKYTIPTLSSNSILFYNPSTALASWADGTVANPIFIGSGSNQAAATSSVKLQATTPTGQLVSFSPPATTPYTTEVSFPVVSAGGSTASWGTIESIVPNQGLVYKNSSGSVQELTGLTTQYVSFDSNGNPVAKSITQVAPAPVQNIIINASFLVNQRGVASGVTATSNSFYFLDRWSIVSSGQSVSWTAANGSNVITAPVDGIQQIIEGNGIQTGTYIVTWNQVSGTTTVTVNGTLLNNGDTIDLVGGVNATIVMAQGSFTDVQLTLGTVASNYTKRLYEEELALCQRYYYKFSTLMNRYIAAAGNFSLPPIFFPVTMRAVPTVTLVATYVSCSFLSISVLTSGFNVNVTTTAATEVSVNCQATGKYITCSAEL